LIKIRHKKQMISFENVSKRFGDRVAVDQLNLQVRDGEILGLLGPNGAGKSTSVALLSGLLQCDQGAVLIDGHTPRDAVTRRRLGVAPQQLALYDQLTAHDNLQFFAALYNLPKATRRADCERVLEWVGLRDRANDKVMHFSGGMQRRLNLAIALLHDPDIIVLDEPTAGVDPQSRNKLFDVIEELKQLGKTIVYTTHYMEEATRLCDRVAIIDQGRLLACDTVNGLVRHYGGDSTIIVHDDNHHHTITTKQAVPQLRELSQQWPNDALIEVRTPTLESVFLQLTGRQLRD
jgi:ABC-2 type transport system ATP-binding protein